MTAIDFYTHVASPLEVAAKIVQKAWAQHGSVRVLTPDAETTSLLDRLLWTQSALSFIPHCRLDSAVAAHTPVIVDDALTHDGAASVLINLHPQTPPFFSRFERLADIVAIDDEAMEAGRMRYRFYRERGYAMRTHDLSGRGD
ncbi:MAG: DNA polymerase III subunit chi [Casimicrobiaceae bacterium]